MPLTKMNLIGRLELELVYFATEVSTLAMIPRGLAPQRELEREREREREGEKERERENKSYRKREKEKRDIKLVEKLRRK